MKKLILIFITFLLMMNIMIVISFGTEETKEEAPAQEEVAVEVPAEPTIEVTKAKAKVYTNVYTEGDRPDFEERAEKVISDFKRICIGLVQPEKLTDHRRRLIYQAEADGVDFTELFERAQQSDFLTGRDGKGGGFGFDWVLEPKNRQKIIEGNYDNRGQPTKSVNSLEGASFDIEKYKKSSLFDD